MAKVKKTKEYKAAQRINAEVRQKYGFTSFAFNAKACEFARIYKEHIPTTCAGRSIGAPMWAAFEKKLFGNGKKVHYKSFGDIKSVASDGKSGIRLIDSAGHTLKMGTSENPMYIVFGTSKGKVLKLEVIIPKNDTYKMEMVERNIRVVRITRKRVLGEWKYFVQLTVEGLPAVRYNRHTGEIKNTLGTGKVGVYIDTTSITLITDRGTKKTIDLNEVGSIISQEKKRNELMQYMDASRRASNPGNYNPDGTIKKGIMINGKKMRLVWNYSKGYKKALETLKNSYRVETEKRMLIRQNITNEILSYGNDIIVNDYPYKYAMQRQPIATDNGVEKRKKAGKNISRNAPSMIISLLTQKITTRGGTLTKIKLKDIDYTTDNYRPKYAEQLLVG